MLIIEIIFLFSFIVLFYTWIGYPLVLYMLYRMRSHNSSKNYLKNNIYQLPCVSVIIAAHNEERVIAKRIENLLEQDYPKDKIEIIIASDGSSDRTVEIANNFKGIKVLDFKENRGRAAVHNDAVKVAKGDILVFTDAQTIFKKDFLNKAIVHFFDKKVGCVVGKLIYKTEPNSVIGRSESTYFNFETKLRESESMLGILIAGTGAALLCRRMLYTPIKESEDVDVMLPLNCAIRGFRTIFESKAIAYDVPPMTINQEMAYRYRDVALSFIGTIRIIFSQFKQFIKRPVLLWSIISRRILRWLTPFFLLSLFTSNLILLSHNGNIYRIIFMFQIFFYLLGAAGWIGSLSQKSIPLASIAYSFIIANIGIMRGIARGIAGKASSAYRMPDR